MTPAYSFRTAISEDRGAIIDFFNEHWGSRHPLVNLPEYFDYYYAAPGGRLHFCLAFGDAKLAAVAGYIPASLQAHPDIWVSLWSADKAARGSGLELMAAMPSLTGCRTLCCNNIRPETRPFYEFLGYTTGRVEHYYRLASRKKYSIASVAKPEILPVAGKATLTALPDAAALEGCGFTPPHDANPHKDMWYLKRRYFGFPHQQYTVFAATLPGEPCPFGLLCTRTIPVQGTAVLRIADYIGDPVLLPQLGPAIDALMQQAGCEYAELYCAGIEPHLLHEAGFCSLPEGATDIIPNYLEPLQRSNTDYYYFTSHPAGFTLFRADGDQDRPYIPL